jgi:hypothetical protein
MIEVIDFRQLYTLTANNPVNLLFFWAVAICFAFGFLGLLAHKVAALNAFSRAAPTLMTSIGVLGTFYGIFVGLQDFDVSNIDRSVPILLEGMKTAFLTSLIGMTGMLIFKVFQSVFTRKAQTRASTTAGDLLQELQTARKEAREDFKRLISALAGDGDASLSTQLSKLRTTNQDQLDQVRKMAREDAAKLQAAFQDFAKTMAENNSKALIEALREVIADFNAKITEQFGENFKHLNEAVGRLLIWQDENMRQLAAMTELFEQVRQGIESSRDAVATIAQDSASIPATMAALQSAVRAAQLQVQELELHLAAFVDLKRQAIEAFPAIRANLADLTGSMRDGAEAVNITAQNTASTAEAAAELLRQSVEVQTRTHQATTEALQSALSAQSDTYRAIEAEFRNLEKVTGRSVEALKDGVEKAIKEGVSAITQSVEAQRSEINALIKGTSDQFKTAVKSTGEALTGAIREHNESMRKSFTEFNVGMENSLRTSTEKLAKQIESLDQQMETELKRSIESMGRKLGGISERLAADYQPLTENIRKMMEAVHSASSARRG